MRLDNTPLNMFTHRTWQVLLFVLSLARTASALYVLPDSDCAGICLGGNSTDSDNTPDPSISTDDVVCRDSDYEENEGIRFRNCMECLRDSEETDGGDSDLKYMLYNMRFAINTCLYENETMVNSPCIIDHGCEPLEDAIITGLDSPGEKHYDYCTADDEKFSSKSHWACVKCLHDSTGDNSQIYLSNFFQTLKAGCEQRPDDGETLSMRGQIFSEELLNITVTNTTLPGEGGAGNNDMTTGTIVGIAVGAGLGVFGIGALIWACLRQRKKRKIREANENGNGPDQTPPPDRSNASSFTALTHSPYLNVGDQKKSPSIRSTEYELQEKIRYGSNADYYDKLEESNAAAAGARGGGRNKKAGLNMDPRLQQHMQGGPLPSHPAYNPRMSNTGQPAVPSNLNPNAAHHRKTNTADSYALQQYLRTSEDVSSLSSSQRHNRSRSATPSGGRVSPPEASRSSAERPSAHQQQAAGGAAAAAAAATTSATLTNIPPPPPGPPPSQTQGHEKKVSLSMPSIPRVRVPKKYAPPTITVDGATPVDDNDATGGRDSQDIQISGPISTHEKRFTDKPLGGPVVVSTDPVPPPSVDPNLQDGERTLHTGKSTLYG